MKPIPNAAPSIPNFAARSCGAATSAMYAPEMLYEAAVAPETKRPTKRIGMFGASAMTA